MGVLDRNDPANVEIAGAPKAAVSPGDQAEGKKCSSRSFLAGSIGPLLSARSFSHCLSLNSEVGSAAAVEQCRALATWKKVCC